jgi:glutamyl-tRNA reductase
MTIAGNAQILAGHATRDAGPVIAALRRRVETVCLAQLISRATPGTPPDDLTDAAHVLASKMLRAPTLLARRAAANDDTDTLIRLCEMFGVPTEAVT